MATLDITDQLAGHDQAGSTVCRLLAGHPDVGGVEMLGQHTDDDGIVYYLGVRLPGGRELYIEARDV